MLEFKHITPQILRDAADRLTNNQSYYHYSDWVYMCHAVGNTADSNVFRQELSEFLNDEGWMARGSRVLSFSEEERSSYCDDEGRQAVRFMLFEFLALMLESENEAQAT